MQGLPALLELRPQFPEDLANYKFGVDVNKCMTKVFVGTTFGLLYKLEMDNCRFQVKMGVAKELFKIMASVEQLALESFFASPLGIVKRKRWATSRRQS